MKVVNKYCPRSGKEISGDSLAEYKNFTVGFCNTECRDDFTNNINERPGDKIYFDILIKEKDL